MRCCVLSIALRRNRSPGAYASRLRMIRIVDTPIAGDVDGPKYPSVPGSARTITRARVGVDRLARDAHLRVGIAVILENLDGTLAGGLLDLVGQRRARPKRQIAFEIFTYRDGKDIESLEPNVFNDNGILGSNFRRRMPAAPRRAQRSREHRHARLA